MATDAGWLARGMVVQFSVSCVDALSRRVVRYDRCIRFNHVFMLELRCDMYSRTLGKLWSKDYSLISLAYRDVSPVSIANG